MQVNLVELAIQDLKKEIHTFMEWPSFEKNAMDPMAPLYRRCDDIADLIDRLEQDGVQVSFLESEYIQLLIALTEAQEQYSKSQHALKIS